MTTLDRLQVQDRRSLRDEAYAVLREALIDGRLSPGTALSEPQLAAMLETSRSPVREALGRLEMEGFVERSSTGRLRVAPLNLDELEQLYVLRADIEGLAARLATPHVTMRDLDSMAATIEAMETKARAGNIAGSLEAGAAFHSAIQSRCGNRPLVETIDTVRLRIVRYRSLIASVRGQDVRVSEHRAVLQAMVDRRPDLAEQAMVEHVSRSAQTIIDALRQ